MSILKQSIKKDSRVQSAKGLLETLKKDKKLPFEDFKKLLEIGHSMLETNTIEPESYNLALSIICHSSEYLPTEIFLRQLLYDCISASRVFLYNEMVSNKNQSYNTAIETSIFNDFSEAYYTLETSTVLTKEQKILFEEFKTKRRIVVSAPTSFGKSRIVQEIIFDNDYANIAIVLPTIALLNETYVKFKENKSLTKYTLINSINNIDLASKNIFILTPEKMDLLLDQNPEIKIDFFTMDEIYKIQDDLERKKIFTHCLYRLSKQKADFYLIGPYFESFSKSFLEKTNSHFIKFTGEIVQKDFFDLTTVDTNSKYIINGKEFKRLKDKDKNLLNIISALNEQTLIYIGRRDSVETRARKIADQSSHNNKTELIDYIKQNIASDWSLVTCLEKGVGFHHSAIPKYIQSEIVDAFNLGKIDVIVCTSTLTEGVNTAAKNVIIFDNFKGNKDKDHLLTSWDVKNIKGRAGRFYTHFIGNVFGLEPLDTEESDRNIEFSYFDNQNLESEEVIQIDKKELTNQNLELRKHIETELKKERIPFELIRKNKFIAFQNQILLIQHLRENVDVLNEVYFDGALPNKDQLEIILKLCHDFLFNKQDRENRNFWIGELTKQTKYYIYKDPPIKLLILNQKGVKIDTKIRSAFSLLTHFFEFALPKYFTAFENIFNFVYQENKSTENAINLKYMITKLEFGFVSNHEIAFKEAGLPNDIISKVEKNFKECKSLEEIRQKIRFNPFLTNTLTPFEKKIFNKYI
jgi:helicase